MTRNLLLGVALLGTIILFALGELGIVGLVLLLVFLAWLGRNSQVDRG